MDPVTAYFKNKSGIVGSALRKLRRTVSEPEEHLLHSYRAHNHNQQYNLSQTSQTGDDPLQESSTTQNGQYTEEAPMSSLNSAANFDNDSYDDDLEAHGEFVNQPPIALHHTRTT